MATIGDFLLARIGEDEERARRAAAVEGADFMLAALPLDVFDGLRPGFPTRVITECGAKREIVSEHGGSHPYYVDPCDAHDASFQTVPCDTLRHLATVYADHPDYNAAWRP